MEKKWVKDTLLVINASTVFYGSLDKCINSIDKIKQSILKFNTSDYKNLKFENNWSSSISLVGSRLETDEEFELRLEKERKAEEAKALREQKKLDREAKKKKDEEIKRYQQYLKLKEEFENEL